MRWGWESSARLARMPSNPSQTVFSASQLSFRLKTAHRSQVRTQRMTGRQLLPTEICSNRCRIDPANHVGHAILTQLDRPSLVTRPMLERAEGRNRFLRSVLAPAWHWGRRHHKWRVDRVSFLLYLSLALTASRCSMVCNSTCVLPVECFLFGAAIVQDAMAFSAASSTKYKMAAHVEGGRAHSRSCHREHRSLAP